MQADTPAASVGLCAGIDPGYARMGIAVVDLRERRVVQWGCLQVFRPNEYQRRKVAGRLQETLVGELGLDACQVVVIEEQFVLRSNVAQHKNRLMHLEGVLSGMFQQTGWIVPASVCKRALGLSSGNYTQNKKLAIKFVQTWVPSFFGAGACDKFNELVEANDPVAADMADAMLQVAFFVKEGLKPTFKL